MSLATRQGLAPPRPALKRCSGRAGWAAAVLAGALALYLAHDAGVRTVAAVPDVARGLGAALVLFAVSGYAVARLLLPASMRADLALFVLPIGAMTSALTLTALGFLGVPLPISLALLLAAGVAAIPLAHRRAPPRRSWPPRLEAARLLWPAYVAALVVGLALIPMLRAGFATTMGENGDAVLAAGVSELLRETPPLGENVGLYVDRMPTNWRSKYPIYYVLAAVTELSGLDSSQVISTLSALMLGLIALGFVLLARHGLGAATLASLLVGALVALDRILVFLSVHPFYNQLWGVFALPLILLFGLRFVREPSRRGGLALAGFALLGAFAYPLMLPFPLVALGGAALVVRRRRRAAGPSPGWVAALRLPRVSRRVAIPLGLLTLPFLAIGLLGVAEKSVAAAGVILPGSDLSGWNALPDYMPVHRSFGLVDPLGIAFVGVIGLLAAAAYACLRQPRDAGLGLLAMGAGAIAFAVSFRLREDGAFFDFKILSFLGPVVVALAVVGLCQVVGQARSRAPRNAAAAALVGLLALFVVGARDESFRVREQLNVDHLELRAWGEELPSGATVLMHLPGHGDQLWASYMLAAHPLSATHPHVSTTFPSPAPGRKGDFLLTSARDPLPPARWVVGDPVETNGSYLLYRMDPGLPGRDTSTRRSFEHFATVFE